MYFKQNHSHAKHRKPLPHFPLTVSLKAKAVIAVTPIESPNVLAKLRGNDLRSKNEYADKTIDTWIANRYHAPSDDTNQLIDLEAAALLEEIVLKLTAQVANADGAPHWKADSFFRRFAAAGNN